MFRPIAALLMLVLLAGDSMAEDTGRIAACLENTREIDRARTCIGLTSDPCMETHDGHTTTGMFACMEAEYTAWDTLLNRYWQPLMAKARALDKIEAEYAQGTPSAAKALRKAQRAWIAWRDAECAYAAAEWGSGTGRGPAHIACLLQLTAERAIGFHLSLREGG